MADKHETEQNKAGSAKNGTAGPNDSPPETAAAKGSSESAGPAANTEPTANLSLKEQLEAARAERDANYDLYLRSQAELQNYRKRVQKEADEMRLYQSLPLARDLLPALDNLDRALAVAENSKNVDELLQGVRMVVKQIEAALGRHQIMAIAAAGKPFDPNLHQAVQQVPTSEHPPMTVVQEVERGFTLKDRVVRPTTVIVAKAPERSAPAQTATKQPASGEPKTGPSTEGE
jgi:molecular chaperone GrpE